MLNMMKILFLCTLAFGCNQSANVDSGSRLERVNSLSYRSLTITKELAQQLHVDCKRILNQVSKLEKEPGVLFKVNESGEIDIIKPSYTSIEDLRNHSYEMWRTKDFEYTALVYQSTSLNADTQQPTLFTVIEIEHEKLTGTYYVFIQDDADWANDEIETSYVDRN